MRFDPTLSPHHHMVCDACGRIHDLHAQFGEVAVPAGAQGGFTITATEIVFRGLCAQCAEVSPGPLDGDRAPAAHPPEPDTRAGTTPTTGEH